MPFVPSAPSGLVVEQDLPWPSRLRWLWLPLAALVLTWLLLLTMTLAIRTREIVAEPPQILEDIRVVQTQRDPNPSQDLIKSLQAAPPPPPAAPQALAQTRLPELSLPALVVSPIDIGTLAIAAGSVNIGVGSRLGSSGVFGGFARGSGIGGNGSGTGNGGGAGAASWKGKPLVPLSTARPQMPEWACKQKLKGWVEAVFTVDTKGHVRDVKIVDADPRGVYEAAAIESISNWIYEPNGANLEVRQRVPMDPADCVYNYH